MSTIAPGTEIGVVRLTVADLERSRSFYERVLGLRALSMEGAVLRLGPADGAALLELHGDPDAVPRDRRLTGLFHFAVLVPSRGDLARALLRLGQTRWPLTGASDHLVSEALYLDDPDGNGIEIYRDRPREEWARDDGGELRMATLPLDLNDILSELPGRPSSGAFEEDGGMVAGTKVGHVHLQVSELAQIEAFYSAVLGFDVVVRSYPGALFVSAGGYHHHVGLNTWNSRGAGPPPPGSVGLRSFDVRVPDAADLAAARGRAQDAGLPVEADDDAFIVRDPSGNAVRLTT